MFTQPEDEKRMSAEIWCQILTLQWGDLFDFLRGVAINSTFGVGCETKHSEHGLLLFKLLRRCVEIFTPHPSFGNMESSTASEVMRNCYLKDSLAFISRGCQQVFDSTVIQKLGMNKYEGPLLPRSC